MTDTISGPRVTLGRSDLAVYPLSLGTNVFGWTADEQQSFAVLDAYTAGGGNFLDTADVYPAWVPGNTGGESETIIGRWLARRGRSDDLVVATKVSQHPDFKGLAPDTIARAADASLQRLGVDRIDLYYAHYDDQDTPLSDTVAAFGELVTAGKVRAVGLSNYTPDRVREWLELAAAGGHDLPVAWQPQYNLVERGIEADVLPLARERGLAVVPYYALASGFLTGKYRDGSDQGSPRAQSASRYLDDRGRAVLAALDEVAAEQDVSVAAVALAWVRHQDGVAAPIASARTVEQVGPLLDSVRISLSPEQADRLTAASDRTAG